MNDTPSPPDGSPRRYALTALLVWLAGSASLMAFAYWWIKPTFRAASQVKVETDNTTVFGSGAHQVDFGQYVQTQAALIVNPVIIGSALSEHPELAKTPMLRNADDREDEIRQALRVEVVPRTNLIQVEMSSPVPAEAAKVVNAVVDAYLKHAHATYDTSTQKRIDLLKITRDEHRAEINKQRALVQSLADHSVSDTDIEAEQIKLEYARKDLQRAEAVFDRIEDALNQLRFESRNPTARVELNFEARPSLRPDTGRRRQLMAAAPVAVGLLVMGPLWLKLHGAKLSDPGLK